MEVIGQLNAPAALPAGRAPGTHSVGWLGCKGGLDIVEEKSLGSAVNLIPAVRNPSL
jgi:hypothetical protein